MKKRFFVVVLFVVLLGLIWGLQLVGADDWPGSLMERTNHLGFAEVADFRNPGDEYGILLVSYVDLENQESSSTTAVPNVDVYATSTSTLNGHLMMFMTDDLQGASFPMLRILPSDVMNKDLYSLYVMTDANTGMDSFDQWRLTVVPYVFLPEFEFEVKSFYASVFDVVEALEGQSHRKVMFPFISDWDLTDDSFLLKEARLAQEYVFYESNGMQPLYDRIQVMDRRELWWTVLDTEEWGLPYDIVLPEVIYLNYFDHPSNAHLARLKPVAHEDLHEWGDPQVTSFYTCVDECVTNGANTTKIFPEKTTQIHMRWSQSFFPYGAAYERIWEHEGKEWVHYRCTWPKDEENDGEVLTMTEPMGFASGEWIMTIKLNGKTVFKDSIFFEGDHDYWDPAGDFDACYTPR